MKRGKWRWKKTRIIIEAAIIGTTVALLVILFAETRFDRGSHPGVALEQAGSVCLVRCGPKAHRDRALLRVAAPFRSASSYLAPIPGFPFAQRLSTL